MNSSVALTKNRARRTMILAATFYQEYGESCRLTYIYRNRRPMLFRSYLTILGG